MFTRLIHIIHKDQIIDQRGRHSFLASLVYLIAVVFVIHKIFDDMNQAVRLGLYWVIIMFSAINIISHSFSNSSKRRKILHYQLYNPYELIVAKLISNFIKLLFAAAVLYLLQTVLTGQGVKDFSFFTLVVLGSIAGIVAILTMVASVSSYSEDKSGLTSILALPLLIPVLMIAMRLSLVANRMLFDSGSNNFLLILLGIDMLLITLVILFFPLVWKS